MIVRAVILHHIASAVFAVGGAAIGVFPPQRRQAAVGGIVERGNLGILRIIFIYCRRIAAAVFHRQSVSAAVCLAHKQTRLCIGVIRPMVALCAVDRLPVCIQNPFPEKQALFVKALFHLRVP